MKKTTSDRAPPRENLLKLMTELAAKHDNWRVFSDFVELAAISISNAVEHARAQKREARYLEVIKAYAPDEVRKFPAMLAELIMELEAEPADVLGWVFEQLDLGNKYKGQFFTPKSISQLSARMLLGDGEDIRQKIRERGFVTALEPACGGGAMIIALAEALRGNGVNYQQQFHVTATDIDPKCVHMAYLQFSLLHIPAVVIHGNSLSLEEFDVWHTPAHILGGWNWKLKRNRAATDKAAEPSQESPADDEAEALQLKLF